MLFVSPVNFHISTSITNPNREKIEAAKNEFEEMIAKIKEDERFKYVMFTYGTPYVHHEKRGKSKEELDRMKKEMEENGYKVTKSRKKPTVDEFELCQLRWRSSAQPEVIRAFTL